jgi:hypothetical protein
VEAAEKDLRSYIQWRNAYKVSALARSIFVVAVNGFSWMRN